MDVLQLSVVVIAQNEEPNLGRCLSSVAPVADELVVIDGGSRDATVEIARRFSDQVYVNPFPGHIEQKNFGLQKAHGEWVLSLDADECLSDELQTSLRTLFPDWSGSCDGFLIHRRNLFLGRWMSHGGWYPDRKLRLVRREGASWGGSNPHDRLLSSGSQRLRTLPGDLLHFTSPDLETHLRKQRRHSRIMAAERFRGGIPPSALEFWLHPLAAFVRSYFCLQGFRDGRHGLVLAALSSLYRLQVAVRLWEMTSAAEASRKAKSGASLERGIQAISRGLGNRPDLAFGPDDLD